MAPHLPLEKRLMMCAEKNLCAFCHTDTDDEMICGRMLHTPGEHSFPVHNFCMLFSSALKQEGNNEDDEDNDGSALNGFLVKDIILELRRGDRLTCTFCRKPGAAIGCVKETCKTKFHLPCGLQNGTFHYFKDVFESYCKTHMPPLPGLSRRRLAFRSYYTSTCHVCQDAVSVTMSRDLVKTNCCSAMDCHLVTRYYHKQCLQKFAISSGRAHFRCLICRDQQKFTEIALDYGIYIPDRDAAWELEEGAFSDQYARPYECTVKPCLCAKGPKFCDDSSALWDIFFCHECGMNGTHLACSQITDEHLNDDTWNYLCTVCADVGVAKCTTRECACPRGRKNVETKGDWKLAMCARCQYNKAHVKCAEAESFDDGEWTCRQCIRGMNSPTKFRDGSALTSPCRKMRRVHLTDGNSSPSRFTALRPLPLDK